MFKSSRGQRETSKLKYSGAGSERVPPSFGIVAMSRSDAPGRRDADDRAIPQKDAQSMLKTLVGF
jgi:hypothetical protein